MKTSYKLIFTLSIAIALLCACSTSPRFGGLEMATLPNYSDASLLIPVQQSNAIRLYVYRPQTFVGRWGRPTVIVDGKKMNRPLNPEGNSMLVTGSVFVVDAPKTITQVSWLQQGTKEESAQVLVLPQGESRTLYLRWELKPTYGYLSVIDEKTAITEIQSLRFSGYVNLLSE